MIYTNFCFYSIVVISIKYPTKIFKKKYLAVVSYVLLGKMSLYSLLVQNRHHYQHRSRFSSTPVLSCFLPMYQLAKCLPTIQPQPVFTKSSFSSVTIDLSLNR